MIKTGPLRRHISKVVQLLSDRNLSRGKNTIPLKIIPLNARGLPRSSQAHSSTFSLDGRSRSSSSVFICASAAPSLPLFRSILPSRALLSYSILRLVSRIYEPARLARRTLVIPSSRSPSARGTFSSQLSPPIQCSTNHPPTRGESFFYFYSVSDYHRHDGHAWSRP